MSVLYDWKLPPLRPSSYATPDDLAARRAAAASVPLLPLSADVTARPAFVADIPCVVCDPPAPHGTVIYLHGGGYRLGSAERSTPFASRLARASGTRVVVVDYRLAPEHPFPAGLQDAMAVYGMLVDQDESLVIAGDSAGGGLAAAVVVAANDAGAPLPAGLVLMSPWLDLTCTAATFESRAHSDELFSLSAARQASEMYLQGHNAQDPLASPVMANVAAWGRTMVLASADEVLLGDTVTLVSTLAMAGVPVELRIERGVPHAWPAVFPDLPESVAALDAIGRFVGTLRQAG